MTLSLLKLEPDMGRVLRWAGAQGLLDPRRDDDLGYALHALLAAVFGTLAPKPFVLQRPAQRPPTLLAYTQADPAALRDHAAAFAEPDASAALGQEHMAAKTMPALFDPGRRLGFLVRTRPTVRVDRDGDRTKSRERDAFLAAIDGTLPGEGPARAAVYQSWLAVHLAAGGAELTSMSIDQLARSIVRRRGPGRRLVSLEGPDATFSGVLRVTDPDAFAGLLARGVGRHRAFGYGMVLLRPC